MLKRINWKFVLTVVFGFSFWTMCNFWSGTEMPENGADELNKFELWGFAAAGLWTGITGMATILSVIDLLILPRTEDDKSFSLPNTADDI